MSTSSQQSRRQRAVSSSSRYSPQHGKTNAPAAKPNQKTLAELDHYRYTEAPTVFALKAPAKPMELEDVKTLVEWKL